MNDDLLQALIAQNTALLTVQAESLRLQRLLVEHLLGATAPEQPGAPADRPPPRIEKPLRLVQPGPRGARYYEPELDLDRLQALAASPDGRLTVTFGPHKGQTLAEIVRTEPAYLPHLAQKAQRSDLRAAAGRLAALLAEETRKSG
ncbi:MAG TPA: hypothetical protein VIR57_08775 [Chloroflexota bacterium]